MKKWLPITLILFLSFSLHVLFYVKNPGINFHNPAIYDAKVLKLYGNEVVTYGSHDAIMYAKMAERLNSEGVFAYDSEKPNAYVTPGHPIYLAIIFRVADIFGFEHAKSAKIINLFVSLATVFVLYLIGKRLFRSELIGTLAATLYGFYFPPLHYFRTTLTETPSIFFMCLAIYFFVVATQTNRNIHHLLFGIITSIALMFRPNCAPLLVTAILIIIFSKTLKESIRIGLLWVIGPIVVIFPWVIRNYIQFHELILFSTQQDPFLAGTNPFDLENYSLIKQQANQMGVSYYEFGWNRIKDGFTNNPVLWISWYTIGKTLTLFIRPSSIPLYNLPLKKIMYIHHFVIVLGGTLTGIFLRRHKEAVCLFLATLAYVVFSDLFLALDRYGFFITPIFTLLAAYGIVCGVKWMYNISRDYFPEFKN
jgi:4-amino-4-deoxy-L-arabinose transferase-like glycosyltransferase